jgi:DNA-binding NtrC family response regulator
LKNYEWLRGKIISSGKFNRGLIYKGMQSVKSTNMEKLPMTKSVIVIDDDEDTVRLFSEFLEENKIKVLGKGYDGKTAVQLYQEKRPDCVLIDMMMPNGSGIYAIKKIIEINPEAKIIAVTGDSRFTTEQKLEKLKIPVIYKPFQMDEVISKIQN